MIQVQEIVQAVCVEIHAEFPEIFQYLDRCPADFQRPCFLIQHLSTASTDATRQWVDLVQRFTITYYRAEEIPEDAVWNLFRRGYLQVGDRAIKVAPGTKSRDWEKITLELQLQYFDDRESVKEQQVMREVSVSIKEE